jgi:arylsulfatase A-like enzyme
VNARPAAWIREGDYKLVCYFAEGENAGNRYELYNIKKDISEERDLADQMPELVDALSKKRTKHFEQTDALLPVPNPGYDPAVVRPEK